MTLMELVEALIQNAADDGASGAEDMSPRVQQQRDEIRRRYTTAIAELGGQAAAILDGRA
jgi:hypothetical protein